MLFSRALREHATKRLAALSWLYLVVFGSLIAFDAYLCLALPPANGSREA